MSLRNFIPIVSFLVTALLNSGSTALAQVNTGVSYRFEKDTVLVNGGQTFTNKLIVENLSGEAVRMFPHAADTKTLSGIITLPKIIALAAGEKHSYPLKFIADRNTIIQSFQTFSVQLRTDNALVKVQKEASFFTNLEDGGGLQIFTEQEEYFLDQSTNRAELNVRLINTGLVPISFHLKLSSSPAGLEFSGEKLLITIPPGAQVLSPFSARNLIGIDRADFIVSISAVQESGAELSAKRIRVMSLTSERRFGMGNVSLNQTENNLFAMRYLSMSKNASIYQLQGSGNLQLGKDERLAYRVNLDHYSQLGILNLYDTYLDFKARSWGIKLGNIYENLDYVLAGRGIKANYMVTEKSSINVFALQNNYLLLSGYNDQIAGAKIIGANYDFKTSREGSGYLSVLHADNRATGVRSGQVNGKSTFSLADRQSLALEGGLSRESTVTGGNNAAAGGLIYSLSSDQYQFNSNNYYSTAYYTGTRRGLFQSDSHLIRSFKSLGNLSGRVSLLYSSPKYQQAEGYYRLQNDNSIHIYELGYGKAIGKVNFQISPYMMFQRLQGEGLVLPLNQPYKWQSRTIRTSANLSFYNTIHSFSVNTDYGYTYLNNAISTHPFHSLRLNASYNLPFAGLTAFLQFNPYYLSDNFNALTTARYRQYSFGPNTRFNALKDKLNVQAAATYNYYGNSESYAISSNIRWALGGKWVFTGDVQWSFLQSKLLLNIDSSQPILQNSFNNRQIRLGIEKQFAAFQSSRGKKLELSYYGDQNNNGIKDNEESYVEGLIVKINGETAITDKKGRVTFKNVQPGDYGVQIMNSKGWAARDAMNILISTNKDMEVPLVKTTVLRGKIEVQQSRYQSVRAELSGIAVLASDQMGNTFKTLTDEEGNYNFYLRPGLYRIFIETLGMSFSIANPSRELSLAEGKAVYDLNFQYLDLQQKVEVTRF
jgi:hypothetical protein